MFSFFRRNNKSDKALKVLKDQMKALAIKIESASPDAILASATAIFIAYMETAFPSLDRSRIAVNTTYVAIQTLIFAGVYFIISEGNGLAGLANGLVPPFMSAFGILVSKVWWVNLLKYREESRVTYKTCKLMGESLPLKPYELELLLKKGAPCFSRFSFKFIEPITPLIVGALHVFSGIAIYVM